MKTYKSSDLTHKRAEVMREAEANGVKIQERRSNGEVIKEFVILPIVHNILTLNKSCGDVEMFYVDDNLLADGDL